MPGLEYSLTEIPRQSILLLAVDTQNVTGVTNMLSPMQHAAAQFIYVCIKVLPSQLILFAPILACHTMVGTVDFVHELCIPKSLHIGWVSATTSVGSMSEYIWRCCCM